MHPDAPALPRSNILSYVARTDSPTRVRRVACRAVAIIGVLLGLPALAMFGIMAVDICSEVKSSLGPALMPPSPPLLWWILEHQAFHFIIFVGFLMLAVPLLFSARPVSRGKPWACVVAICALFPCTLMLVIASVALPTTGLLFRLGVSSSRSFPAWLILLLPGAVSVIALLLVYDVFRCLEWIARNPITDAPKIPFLPGHATG